MTDWNKIKKCQANIKINNDKLLIEKDFKKKEKLRLKNRILELQVKILKLD